MQFATRPLAIVTLPEFCVPTKMSAASVGFVSLLSIMRCPPRRGRTLVNPVKSKTDDVFGFAARSRPRAIVTFPVPPVATGLRRPPDAAVPFGSTPVRCEIAVDRDGKLTAGGDGATA